MTNAPWANAEVAPRGLAPGFFLSAGEGAL